MSPLRDVLHFLQVEVKPNAAAIDRDPEALGLALKGLCDGGWMALKRPDAYGGPAISESDFRHFQEEVARVSGSLAFLQTQHQSAVSMIARSDNEALRQAYLPHMHNGKKLVGIGFSQLRRAGPPMITARPVDGGYRLNGHVPWVTGWSFFPEFLVGATLPTGEAVFGVVPLVAGPGISISAPMELAAMESAQTVTMDFSDFLLTKDQVAFIRPSGWIQNNDMINVTLQGHFALGCARAGLDILLENAHRKLLPFLQTAWDALDAELERCRATIVGEPSDQEHERLKLRAWAIDLAARCAHAAVVSSSGAANSMSHPAQRVYREALVFTVSAQTAPIMEASLQRLVSRQS